MDFREYAKLFDEIKEHLSSSEEYELERIAERLYDEIVMSDILGDEPKALIEGLAKSIGVIEV